MQGEKKCTKCKKLKPLEQYHIQNTMADKRASSCKTCVAILGRIARDKKKQENLEYAKRKLEERK